MKEHYAPMPEPEVCAKCGAKAVFQHQSVLAYSDEVTYWIECENCGYSED